MTPCGDLRILFRAPAGPRRGFGHLVRCRSLARALGVRPLIALRGGTHVVDTALALGCDVVHGTARQLIDRLSPDVVVVDDPIAADARRWIRAAKRAGCLVVSLHDLGIGCREADLVIDGSITQNARAIHGTTLAGPSFAVLDPSNGIHAVERDPYSVLVALGGGPRAELAQDIAEAIVAVAPRARVRIAGGFSRPPEGSLHDSDAGADSNVGADSDAGTDSNVGAAFRRPKATRPNITWIGPVQHLHEELARASVAVVGGGVTMYEACANGVVPVAVPVVAAQRPTVKAFVARGVARGVTRGPIRVAAVASECAQLLDDEAMRMHMASLGRKLIDGRGAFRAAAAVSRLRARQGEQ